MDRGTQGPVWYDYAVLRAVPRVDRGECINIGVVLFCREANFLGARVRLRRDLVRRMDPEADLQALDRVLKQVVSIADGDPTGGPVARLPRPDRFHWLTAPRSTVLQPSPVHTGRTDAPADTLAELFEELVG